VARSGNTRRGLHRRDHPDAAPVARDKHQRWRGRTRASAFNLRSKPRRRPVHARPSAQMTTPCPTRQGGRRTWNDARRFQGGGPVAGAGTEPRIVTSHATDVRFESARASESGTAVSAARSVTCARGRAQAGQPAWLPQPPEITGHSCPPVPPATGFGLLAAARAASAAARDLSWRHTRACLRVSCQFEVLQDADRISSACMIHITHCPPGLSRPSKHRDAKSHDDSGAGGAAPPAPAWRCILLAGQRTRALCRPLPPWSQV
jgi:hypothetical protein